ncbi:MAG: deoxyribonuclease IV [Candidatus Omnitrophica bacterium]|nr:deoxyribonuclease IV [Candidatus Omnitrophota bacterium]
MLRIGVHISISKGLLNALREARSLKCTAMQIFVRNPRGYAGKKIDAKEADSFIRERELLDIRPLVVHGSYLLNTASSDAGIRKQSIKAIQEDLRLSSQIKADFYVLHFGSNPDRDKGIEITRGSLAEILIEKFYPVVLMENTAGEGNKIGSNVQDIGAALKGFGSRLGICLDSAHLCAAGVNPLCHKELDIFLKYFDDILGTDKIKLLHINDSLYQCRSRRDRHQHIGHGFIKNKGIANFINHPKLKGLPLILETPKDKERDDIKNLNRVECLIK